MRVFISTLRMVLSKRKFTQVYLMKDFNMVYLILDNPLSSSKMISVKKLNSLEGIRGRRTQLCRGLNTKLTSLIKEKRDNVYARLIRKHSVIEDLFYCSKNITIIEEEICQFDDKLKLLMPFHKGIHTM